MHFDVNINQLPSGLSEALKFDLQILKIDLPDRI